jgi:hypothetical protein
MQIAAMLKDLKESITISCHIITRAIIHHARQVYVRVEGYCHELLQLIRTKIALMLLVHHKQVSQTEEVLESCLYVTYGREGDG